MAESRRTSSLIIIGGHEDKGDERVILREVASHARGGSLVVCTVASSEADEMWETYREVFGKLNVRKVEHLHIDHRDDAFAPDRVELVERASVVFFTGGDQLKISSQIGDTPVFRCMRDRRERGLTIAGTSAGASVMSETMLVSGAGDDSHKVGDMIGMSPGLGFVKGALIDQHFAERGRIGRLVAAVTQNPRILGIGVDENTAIVVDGDTFRVIGDGGVYVVDGQGVSWSNVSEASADETLAVADVRLHLLGDGLAFDMKKRRPIVNADRGQGEVVSRTDFPKTGDRAQPAGDQFDGGSATGSTTAAA